MYVRLDGRMHAWWMDIHVRPTSIQMFLATSTWHIASMSLWHSVPFLCCNFLSFIYFCCCFFWYSQMGTTLMAYLTLGCKIKLHHFGEWWHLQSYGRFSEAFFESANCRRNQLLITIHGILNRPMVEFPMHLICPHSLSQWNTHHYTSI